MIIKVRRAGLALLVWLTACGQTDAPVWNEEAGYRWRELTVASRSAPGFSPVGTSSGLDFTNAVTDSAALDNRILVQGAGVAIGDVDGDGRPDVYLASIAGANGLFLNQGDWRFSEEAAERGVATPDRASTGVVLADVDGDGDLDLILNTLGGPDGLFLNDGSGHFTEATAQSGLVAGLGSTTSTLADVDGDGDLDLFTTTYKPYTTLDRISPQDRGFDQVVHQVSPDSFVVQPRYQTDYRLVPRPDLGGITMVQRADPDLFYLNDGTGRFQRIPFTDARFTNEDGRQLPYQPESFGLAARFGDFDDNGTPDLYIANDFEDPDEFWLNDGRGNFRLAPRLAIRNTSNSSMAVDFADVNRDGRTDFFLVDMLSRDTRRLKTQTPTHTALPKLPGDIDNRPQVQRNTLFLNRGDGTWAEVAAMAHVEASGWSWSTMFLDVDLDGFEDLLVGTGHPWDVMDSDVSLRLRNRLVSVPWQRTLSQFPALALDNVALRNRGDSTFEDASETWRFAQGPDISHGMAAGDLDGDGDLDLVINRLNAPAAVLQNTSAAARISIQLVGSAPNTRGIGSRVRILGGPVPLQEREVTAGGLYLSGSDQTLTFATGSADSVTIEVTWRDGRRSRIAGARPNRAYQITPDAGPVTTPPESATVIATLFEDRTDLLGHSHHESIFEEYSRQFLLPNGYGLMGPGIAWVDLDRDGDEDLAIGTGAGGRPAIFRNDGGGFSRWAAPLPVAPGDLTGLVGVPDGQGGLEVLAGMSSYESRTPEEANAMPAAVRFRPGSALQSEIPGDSASSGPIALADYDQDGDLDLFVGGRILPGGYPHSPTPRLFRREGDRFFPDNSNSAVLARAGMASAAVFSDIDGDGDQDLLIAVEWGPIKLFLNDRGRFSRAPESYGLSRWFSRWNGIATGDLDGDGRLDIVATSWGKNVSWHASEEHPLLLYFGQLGERTGVDLLMSAFDPRLNDEAPLISFGRLGVAVPAIAERLRTYQSYADATVAQVMGTAAPGAQRLGANTLEHMVFLNRGDHFESRPLPSESMLAPAFYAGIADFDGDGNEDVVLSQNFFATEIGTPRFDGGRGLLLTGNGLGGLTAVPGNRSGITVYGEQRGAGYADYDGDGRLDLVISQNAGPTRLLKNVTATPGLRVRLVGTRLNPDAIGSQMRLVYPDSSMGPVREVQAGAGYWSQNGAIQVMGRRANPVSVQVRWPDGTTTRAVVPDGALTVVIHQ